MTFSGANDRRVLVTGSEGYIGSVLVPILIRAGYAVTGLDTCWFSEGRLLPTETKWPVIRLDVRDVELRDLRGYDAVIHLAAICNDPLGELDPELTHDINYRASIRLAEMARAAGVARFVFFSSCSMYGVAGGDAALDESAPFTPLTAYARSKVEAERELAALAANHGFCTVMLRNATAYGVSPRQRFDLVVPNLAGHAHVHGEVRLTSDGTPWRPLVHIRDIGAAVLAVLAAPVEAVLGQAFNVGRDTDNYTIRDIALHVQQAYPASSVTFGPPGGDNRSYRVDFSKLHTLPDFTPRWSLDRGIRECRDVFTKVGLNTATFEDRLYTRLKQIRHLLDRGFLNDQLRWREARTHAA